MFERIIHRCATHPRLQFLGNILKQSLEADPLAKEVVIKLPATEHRNFFMIPDALGNRHVKELSDRLQAIIYQIDMDYFPNFISKIIENLPEVKITINLSKPKMMIITITRPYFDSVPPVNVLLEEDKIKADFDRKYQVDLLNKLKKPDEIIYLVISPEFFTFDQQLMLENPRIIAHISKIVVDADDGYITYARNKLITEFSRHDQDLPSVEEPEISFRSRAGDTVRRDLMVIHRTYLHFHNEAPKGVKISFDAEQEGDLVLAGAATDRTPLLGDQGAAAAANQCVIL